MAEEKKRAVNAPGGTLLGLAQADSKKTPKRAKIPLPSFEEIVGIAESLMEEFPPEFVNADFWADRYLSYFKLELSRRIVSAMDQGLVSCTSGVSDDHAATVPPRLGGIEKELLDLMMVEDGSGLSRLLIRFLDVGGQTSGTRAILDQVELVHGFMQCGGLWFLQEQLGKLSPDIPRLGSILRLIASFALDVQCKVMMESGDIAHLIAKLRGHAEEVAFFAHHQSLQKCLLRGHSVPDSVASSTSLMIALAMSDDNHIRNQLLTCVTPATNGLVPILLRSKSAEDLWLESCGRVVDHSRAAGVACSTLASSSDPGQTTSTSTTTPAAAGAAAGTATSAAAGVEASHDQGGTEPATTAPSAQSSSDLAGTSSQQAESAKQLIEEECDQQITTTLQNCLRMLAGRCAAWQNMQKSSASRAEPDLSGDIDKLFSHSVLSIQVQMPGVLLTSCYSKYRKFAIKATEMLLEDSKLGELSLFTRLPEWTMLKESIASCVCSADQDLAKAARHFVAKHGLQTPSLKNICLLRVSESVMQLQSVLHTIPPVFLKRLRPCVV
eukprot:scpid44144/ scgid32695/ 